MLARDNTAYTENRKYIGLIVIGSSKKKNFEDGNFTTEQLAIGNAKQKHHFYYFYH